MPCPAALLLLLASRSAHALLNGDDAYSVTTAGPVVGRVDAGVASWLGIRYAAPPVGRLRFMPPEDPEAWEVPVNTTSFGPDCWQSRVGNLDPPGAAAEDCLFLNVWAPRRVERQHAVMVWLHGGAFQMGAASRAEYWGEALAKRGVVLVSLNYRLGALGFAVSVDDGLWGNNGLEDQRKALQWVQANVASFGGDPQRVTIFGESAGAMCVGLHLLSEDAGHLFHGAIVQSNPFGYKYRSLAVANFLGQVRLYCLSEVFFLSSSPRDLLPPPPPTSITGPP